MLKGSCHLIFVLRAAICMFHEIMKDNPVVEAKTISSHFPGDNQKNHSIAQCNFKKNIFKMLFITGLPIIYVFKHSKGSIFLTTFTSHVYISLIPKLIQG